MRLLIADKLHPRAIEEIRALPVEVIYEPELTKETLENTLDRFGILVVRSTQVTGEAIAKAKHLNLIVRAGAEHHTIDVKAASQRGIYVAHCPGKNGSAVAELVMGMMVALDRRIPDAVTSLRQGRWERTEYVKAEGLQGKTLGILGMGAIGREGRTTREGVRSPRDRVESQLHPREGGRARRRLRGERHRSWPPSRTSSACTCASPTAPAGSSPSA